MSAGTRYRIGLLRQQAGVTRAQLAAGTGRSAKMIERYENGRIEPPADVLVKMAALLGTTIDELLGLPPRVPTEIQVNGRTYIALPEAATGGGSDPSGRDSAREDSGASHAARKDDAAAPAQTRRRARRRPSG